LAKQIFLIAATIVPLLLLTNSAFAQQKKGLVVVGDNGFIDNNPDLPQYHITL
jgi:hypothetical protein